MSIDKAKTDGSYEYIRLKPTGYSGAGNSNALYLVGMTGRRSSSKPSTIELYLINGQPSFSPSNEVLDQKTVGGNSTIEVFSTSAGLSSMTHVRTFHHPQLATPNNVALLPDGSIYYTNDHGLSRAGWRHELSPLLRTGDVSHCTATTPPVCKQVATGFAFPNGLHYSRRHNKLFVPSAAIGDIHVYTPLPNHDLEFVETIKVAYPIDNLSEDNDGSIIAAIFPSTELFEKFKDHDPSNSYPLEVQREMRLHGANKIAKEPASGAMRIRRVGKGPQGERWEVEKIIEDNDGEVLPASTTVIRDAKTGRLLMSSVVSEWIAVCEPK